MTQEVVKYRKEKENAGDNSVDNASNGTVVIADPLPEQCAALVQDVIVTE